MPLLLSVSSAFGVQLARHLAFVALHLVRRIHQDLAFVDRQLVPELLAQQHQQR
jgi:hypothetical protein